MLVFFALQSTTVNALITKKLLVIGIDGCRADAITPALAPTITALLPNSTYSFTGLTSTVTMSCVGWSNMCTGVWPTKHNIMNSSNDFSMNNYAQWPDFFTYIERSNTALNTASFCNWGPLNTYLYHTDYEVNTATYSDAITTQNAVTYITNNNPDALLVDLDEVDHAGHAASFDPANATYAAAVTTADGQVASLINAVKARPTYANEDWLIIITTDHGGNGTSGHGNGSLAERRVWTVINGGTATQNNNIANTSTTAYSIANSVNFNGTGNYLKATNKTAFNFGISQDFSIECKVKISTISGDPCVISNQNWNNGINKGFSLYVQNGLWYFNMGDGVNKARIVGSPIADGMWHTLTATIDRDKYIAIYQDGVFIGSVICDNIGDITSGLELAIAQDGTTTYGSKLNGSVGDVRVWNKALSANEISQWYNQTISSLHPSYNTLNAYWKLDDGTGATATDSKGTNHLLYNGGPSSVAVVWNGLTNSTTPTFDNAMKMVDIAVTALDHFSLRPLNLDGKSLLPSTGITAPVANFSTDITTVSKNNSVTFTNTATNNPTSVSWSFPGGTPSTSVDANPIIKYTTPGTYDVIMTATNAGGTDTKTSLGLITVTNTSVQNTLNFDGTSNYILLPKVSQFLFAKANFTIEAWIKPATQTSDPAIISDKDWDSGANVGYALYQKSGAIKFNISDGTTRINGTNDIVVVPTTAFVADKWIHIAITVNRAGNIVTYLNGIAQTTVSCTTMLNSVNTYLNPRIADDGEGNYVPKWKGQIDEVRIWKTERTAAEILNNLMSEIVTPETNPNLVAYYNFNNASGLSLTDQKWDSQGILSGSMTNANWVASGAFRDVIQPAVPTGLSSSNLISTSLTLNWTAATDNVGVTGYKIYNGTTLLTTTTNLTYDVAGLSPNTAYTFNVSAIDAQANESAKATLNVSTSITALKTVESGLIGKVYAEKQTLFIENISGGECEVEIFNALGQKLKTVSLKGGMNSVKVRAAGVYVIKTGSGDELKKVVVK